MGADGANRCGDAQQPPLLGVALDTIEQGIVLVDGGLRLVLANRRAADLLGLAPAALAPGLSWPAAVTALGDTGAFADCPDDPDARQAWDEALTAPLAFKRRRPDGTVIEVRSTPLPGGGFVRTVDDVTAQVRSAEGMFDALQAVERAYATLRDTQDTLVQAEKMASLALLVAGVAHEIETPVGIAFGCSSHLSARTAALTAALEGRTLKRSDLAAYAAAAAEAARLIQQNLGRAAELVRSFKLVAVDQTSRERRRFVVTAYLREVVLSLGPKLKPGGHTVTVTGPEWVEMDSHPGALSQIVTNLTINAVVHGFAGRSGGRVTLAVEEDREGGEVVVRFRDDGVGMTPDVQARIFEPFFTTRRGTGGNGLGLHIVFNLVTQTLSGRILVDSTPGGGTTFTLRLPQRAPVRD